MSGMKAANNHLEVFLMCNNGFGGNFCWIIILLLLFCGCGNNCLCGGNYGGNYGGNGCGCDNNCGCGC